jgi:uncharacterized membrane protein
MHRGACLCSCAPHYRQRERKSGGRSILGTGQREVGGDRDRIVNLIDGVFATPLTLLVLDIRVPDIPENLVATELPAALRSLWLKGLGYFLSSVVLITFWLIHHSVFRSIRAYDRVLLWLNFLFLMLVVSCPSPPRCSGSAATTNFRWPIYAVTLGVGRLLLTAIHWYSTRDSRLLDEAQDPATVHFFLIRGLTMAAIFLLSIVISFFSVSAAICTWLIMIAIEPSSCAEGRLGSGTGHVRQLKTRGRAPSDQVIRGQRVPGEASIPPIFFLSYSMACHSSQSWDRERRYSSCFLRHS